MKNILQKIRKILFGFFAFMGFAAFLSLMLSLFVLSQFTRGEKIKVEDQTILTYHFKNNISESPQASLFTPFDRDAVPLHDLILTLNRAKDDPRVKGFIARINPGDYSPAHIQEFHAILRRFQEAGKFTAIYSESFGEFGNGTGMYYLASAFQQIWMQPVGTVNLTGLRADIPFLRETFDKIGIEPQFMRRDEYKNAPELFTGKEFSPAYRETVQSLLDDLNRQITSDIAAYRGIDSKLLNKIMNDAPLSDRAAIQAELIDNVAHLDQFIDFAQNSQENGANFMALRDYQSAAPHKAVAKDKVLKKVAFLQLDGIIPAIGTPSSAGTINVQAVEEALMEIQNDTDITAILVRVNSPGGVPSAAESIRHALTLVKSIQNNEDIKRPVYVSMGAAAASGGYWISANADKIFALPATMTGSIGVYGGKFVASGLWDKIGVNWEHIQTHKNADLWTANEGYSTTGRIKVDMMMNEIYDVFIDRVAHGRNMETDAVIAVAAGRVWTGQQAVDNGLVDHIGGMMDTLDALKIELGLQVTDKVELIPYPRPKTKIEQLLELVEQFMSVGVFANKIQTEWQRLGILSGLNSYDRTSEIIR